MGIVRSIQKGEQPASKFSKDAQDAAKKMKKSSVKKYAKTKHDDLPVKKESLSKSQIKKMRDEFDKTGELPAHLKKIVKGKKEFEKKFKVKDIEIPGLEWMSKLGEAADRDYKAEYKKFQSSTKAKKYRAELNKYNRQKGTYGNGDGKDASHKGGKIVGFEKESTNRGRAEKSRLKKEDIQQEIDEYLDNILEDLCLCEACQKGYMTHPTRKTKEMFGKRYRNCIKKEDMNEAVYKLKRGSTNKDLDELDALLARAGFKGKPDFNKMTWSIKNKNPKIAKIIKSKGGKKIKESVDEAVSAKGWNMSKKFIAILGREVKNLQKYHRQQNEEDFLEVANYMELQLKYMKKNLKESVNEVSFSKVSTEKLLKHYKQMADERLSGSAALTFRLIAKELRKRKVRLPEIKESVNEGTCGYGIDGKIGEEPAGPNLMKKIKKISKDKEKKKILKSKKEGVNELQKMRPAVKKLLKQKGYSPIFQAIDNSKRQFKQMRYSRGEIQDTLIDMFGDEDPKILQKIKESVNERLNQSQAKTLLRQLGGNKFIMMTGAKQMSIGKDGLMMKIGRNSKSITHVAIDLDRGKDLYTMKFIRVRKGIPKVVKKYDSIYADNLNNIFEKETGLYTRL